MNLLLPFGNSPFIIKERNYKKNFKNIIMKKILLLAALALYGVSAQAQLKPFVSFDYSDEEKRSTGAKNAGVNVTIGIKAPNKWEYSIKAGYSDPAAGTSNSQNVEAKIKKSFDIGAPVIPYIGLRVGQKTQIPSTPNRIVHYAVDLGIKIPIAHGFALDVGSRYRNSFESSDNFDSVRHHATLLYDFNENNTVGLRYTQSHGADAESKNAWRVHYTYTF